MAFREIVAPTVKELFIQQLEGMILSGELRPGDRLPTERELADEMKISKTVVHEGLRELHRLGFLDIASRRGVTLGEGMEELTWLSMFSNTMFRTWLVFFGMPFFLVSPWTKGASVWSPL